MTRQTRQSRQPQPSWKPKLKSLRRPCERMAMTRKIIGGIATCENTVPCLMLGSVSVSSDSSCSSLVWRTFATPYPSRAYTSAASFKLLCIAAPMNPWACANGYVDGGKNKPTQFKSHTNHTPLELLSRTCMLLCCCARFNNSQHGACLCHSSTDRNL